MSSSSSQPVVVGVDGSTTSDHALEWAAREADRRRAPLRIVHAFVWPMMRGVPLGPPPVGAVPDSGLRGQAEALLREAAERARTTCPDLDVETAMPVGAVGVVLVDESAAAQLMVLGSRGLGGFSGLLVGSSTVQVSAHATCPVIVVPPDTPGEVDGPVVVGVDGSDLSKRALEFGFEKAEAHGVSLVAVHAWREPATLGYGEIVPVVHDVEAIEEEERALLAESLAGWREKYPDVRVEQRVVHGQAARALIMEAGSAQLLVVGSRGRGGFRGLLLGSVSQTVLHNLPCPVAIVR